MISVEEASSLVNSNYHWSLRTTQDLYADRDYPPFHRVMMDGIAICYESYLKGVREYPIVGVAAAGKDQIKLNDLETCIEVMTGAMLPENADIVIPYEQIEIFEGRAKIITESQRELLEFVHLQGSDCKKGEIILNHGAEFNGPHVGIAASVGQNLSLDVPRVLIISTGDELVELSEVPKNYQTRRSNAYAIKSSLELNGFNKVDHYHLKDDPKEIFEHYQNQKNNYDIFIYSGGVSKGKFDYLPSVWSDLNIKKIFHGVAQKPGKPLYFGKDLKHDKLILGLPGNPVSSLVCLHRYIIPNKNIWARLADGCRANKTLSSFVPVQTYFDNDSVLWANPIKIKNSGEFSALARSSGFIELPKSESEYALGENVKFYPWRSF